MRLIDADALKPDYYEEYEAEDDEYVYRYYSEEQIDKAPSIDIVRCKECKHTYKWDSGCGAELVCKARRCDPSDWGNDRIEFYVKADDFCSYGERKESE